MEQGARPADRAGFVLVGGRSSRMGQDKALLAYRGGTLVEHVAALVETAAGSVTLIGPPERYRSLPYRVIPDLHPDNGPLGGLETALENSTAAWNLVVACDMPALTADFLSALFERAQRVGGECLVPVSPGGRLEPLCAVYHRTCLTSIRRAMRQNIRKMTDALSGFQTVYWPVADARWLANINTPEDWSPHQVPPGPAARSSG